jgi:leucyl-tRNA---protein transferase
MPYASSEPDSRRRIDYHSHRDGFRNSGRCPQAFLNDSLATLKMMISLQQFRSPPTKCNYLPSEIARTEYQFVIAATPAEFEEYLILGWRHFGRTFFRPVCAHCRSCQSVRVPVPSFRPDRSQKRAFRDNSDIRLTIGEPSVTEKKLVLYDRYHQFRSETVGWHKEDEPRSPDDYARAYVDSPFPMEEWCYFLGDRLVGVGYVDVVPTGLSAIYFYYEPDECRRSLGTFNVLKILESARTRKLTHVYLGYYVAGCRSLEYKVRFRPNEVLLSDGDWVPFG